MSARMKITKTLDRVGLDVLSPLVHLAAGDKPKEQLRTLGSSFGLPGLAIALVLLVWSGLAASISTSIGSVPGPREVWQEAANLLEDHRAERQKEAEFYARMETLKVKWEEQGREWKERKYSGRPTYLDQIGTSLKTVFAGFLLASLLAVPIGIVCGASARIYAALNPLIQVLKPISPLAWLPIVMIMVSALYTSKDPVFEKSFISSAVTVALCSLWPTLVNTALGVSSVDRDHINVARVLKLGWFARVTKIILPSSLPLIFAGLRLSLGVGWMVLIAAEMLAQNPGLGKFVWDMFQNGSSQTLAQIMVAVVTIGLIGFALDRIMIVFQRLVSFETQEA